MVKIAIKIKSEIMNVSKRIKDIENAIDKPPVLSRLCSAHNKPENGNEFVSNNKFSLKSICVCFLVGFFSFICIYLSQSDLHISWFSNSILHNKHIEVTQY